jgi:hypothetical protein
MDIYNDLIEDNHRWRKDQTTGNKELIGKEKIGITFSSSKQS